MPRIGIHKLIETHVNSCFSSRSSFRETADSLFERLSLLEDGSYNKRFFTREYLIKEIALQYNGRKNRKNFRGDNVKQAVYALFKYNYTKYGRNWAFLPQTKIAEDLGICSKTVQRALNQMKEEGLLVLEKKWSSFKKTAAEYCLTAKGFLEAGIITKTIEKAKSVFEKYNKQLIDRVADCYKKFGKDYFLFNDYPVKIFRKILDELVRQGELERAIELCET